MKSDPRSRADELSVQQLRSFCLVYERQSYAAAARELGLAVPTIWEQIRAVERRYGTSLFARQGRRIVPNAPADLLHEMLRPMLTGLDSTFALLADTEKPRSVTLVCGMRMLSDDLGATLKRFHHDRPDVRLRLLHGDLRAAEQLVVADEADLALILEPAPGQMSRNVSFERAYPIDYLAVLPTDHPLAGKKHLRLRDLAGCPLVLGHAGTSARRVVEQALHRERLEERLQLVAETDNSAFTVSCVRAGLGIGIIAGQRHSQLTRDLVTKSLRRELGQAHVIFLRKRGKHLTPAVETLMDLVREFGASAGPQ